MIIKLELVIFVVLKLEVVMLDDCMFVIVELVTLTKFVVDIFKEVNEVLTNRLLVVILVKTEALALIVEKAVDPLMTRLPNVTSPFILTSLLTHNLPNMDVPPCIVSAPPDVKLVEILELDIFTVESMVKILVSNDNSLTLTSGLEPFPIIILLEAKLIFPVPP